MLTAPLCNPRSVSAQVAELVRPPRRMRPSEAAAAYLSNDRGPWSAELTPELIEPLDVLGSRQYRGVVFVGPARTGKTMTLILGGVAYIVTCAPGDTLIVQMSQDTARDFSRMDLDRAIRHSPEIAARLSPRAKDDNTYDKFWRSGTATKLGWPAVSQVSGKTLQYVFLTDYDRPENRDDVDGEGPLWDLAFKRTETYMSRGKCLAESSPGENLLDPRWRGKTPHEAPPVRGILSLYNRGTRARLYWPCLHCGTYAQAEPGLGSFDLPPFDELEGLVVDADLMGLADQYAKVVCRSCGGVHTMSDRPAMKARARWVHEGETIQADGSVAGERRRTDIASYWLGGLAAAYQRWDSIVFKYLQAVQTYVRTRDEKPLQTTTNTDQAAPYIPRAVLKRRGSEALMERVEDWPRGVAPAGVRFLTAAVDLQASKFVVHVFGWGLNLESWLVDRFAITSSRRPEGDRTAGLDPASYVEDWELLGEALLDRQIPVDGRPDVQLPIMLVMCDSGGREGVTEKAYDYWRSLRVRGLHRKFCLVKGTGNHNAPRVQKTWPDSRGRKDRAAGGRGDVPVYLLNVNLLKDGVAGDLARDEPGPGFHHVPSWVEPEFFDELTAETRTEKGWRAPSGTRNEAFDLHVYNRAACILLKAETINWTRPPLWAADPAERAPTKPAPIPAAAPAAQAAPKAPASSPWVRRTGRWMR